MTSKIIKGLKTFKETFFLKCISCEVWSVFKLSLKFNVFSIWLENPSTFMWMKNSRTTDTAPLLNSFYLLVPCFDWWQPAQPEGWWQKIINTDTVSFMFVYLFVCFFLFSPSVLTDDSLLDLKGGGNKSETQTLATKNSTDTAEQRLKLASRSLEENYGNIRTRFP